MQSFSISKNLFLVSQSTKSSSKVVPSKPSTVNHIVMIDCSGSMSSELPKIREQLKKKLPKLIDEKDTVSVVWFSGRKEFGVLLEAEPVSTLKDLNDVNKAIDRWLKPVGLTGFKEPLEEVTHLVGRIKKKSSGAFSLFFMSDGYDNQWPKGDILKAVESCSGSLSSATFVEYGYYADRNLLSSMAEKAGGQLIFARDFDGYDPVFEKAFQGTMLSAKKQEVQTQGDVVGGFVWATQGDSLVTYGVTGNAVSVPEDLGQIWYLSSSQPKGALEFPNLVGLAKDDPAFKAAYAAMSLFSVRMQPQVVWPLLSATGDVKFIEQFSKCFGKQKYSEFMEDTKKASCGEGILEKGQNWRCVPNDDAFTVLELLEMLSSDPQSRILLDHGDFKYNRISRGRVDASEVLTKDEQNQIASLTTKMASEKDIKKLKELQEELASITAGKGDALKFVAEVSSEGYAISNLVYNGERPNISILIRKTGSVDLSKRLPEAFKGKVPETFPTFIFRNYAIVQDGMVNVKQLPVRVSKKLAEELSKVLPSDAKPKSMVVSEDYVEGVINLDALPVVNRTMVQSVSAQELFTKEFELLQAQAKQKVSKAFLDERTPKKESASFKASYGDEAAEWLKGQGFTDYSGFSPKAVQAESTDFYVGKELHVSIKGYSKLPSMSEYKKQVSSNKLNGPGALMHVQVQALEQELKKPSSDEEKLQTLSKETECHVEKTRSLIRDLAKIKFSVVVGQVWFKEFKSLDENTLKVTSPDPLNIGQNLTLDCKVEMNEVEIKI